MIIIEVYVDDIIFGSDNERLSRNFSEVMQKEFEMSMLGELGFFLGLQIYQKKMEFSSLSPNMSRRC